MRRFVLLSLALAASVLPAAAHPHVSVEARTELVLDADARVVALRQAWTFDEVFSSFAKQGLDTDGDGRFSREELASLAEVNVTSLAEYAYFTWVRSAGAAENPLDPPRDYWLDHDDATGRLTLHFTMPLRTPVSARGDGITVQVFDPEYFVAFEFAETDPARLADAPAGCRLAIKRPRGLDQEAAAELSQLPATVRNLPPELLQMTQDLSNDVTVTCP